MTNKQTGFHPEVPKSVRSHLVGENHSKRHRFIFGLLVSYFGVLLSYVCGHSDTVLVAVIGDHIGYGLHGLGFIPMYKAVEGGIV